MNAFRFCALATCAATVAAAASQLSPGPTLAYVPYHGTARVAPTPRMAVLVDGPLIRNPRDELDLHSPDNPIDIARYIDSASGMASFDEILERGKKLTPFETWAGVDWSYTGEFGLYDLVKDEMMDHVRNQCDTLEDFLLFLREESWFNPQYSIGLTYVPTKGAGVGSGAGSGRVGSAPSPGSVKERYVLEVTVDDPEVNHKISLSLADVNAVAEELNLENFPVLKGDDHKRFAAAVTVYLLQAYFVFHKNV